jgi:hypothetical protein
MGIYNIFLRKVHVADDGKVQKKIMRKRDLVGIFLSGYVHEPFKPRCAFVSG